MLFYKGGRPPKVLHKMFTNFKHKMTNQTKPRFYTSTATFSVVTSKGKRLNYAKGETITPAQYLKLPTTSAQGKFVANTDSDYDVNKEYTEAELDLIVSLYLANFTKNGWLNSESEVVAQFSKVFPRRLPSSVKLSFATCKELDENYEGKGCIGSNRGLGIRLFANDPVRFRTANPG